MPPDTPPPPLRVVVTDSNVLINLMHVARLELLGRLPGYQFVIPDHVREEIVKPEQRETLEAAIGMGTLSVESLTLIEDLLTYTELTVHVGRGEAACLVMAVRQGYLLASDEKGRFRREALSRLGDRRLLGTAEVFLLAIGAGLLSIEEADRDKATLERLRFKMPFSTFGDRLGEPLFRR
ncbi:MAG: hypothetical protein HYZ13_09195 [Acidobacteria bacterium]|nr:hypothetical protein [Acidobacteriota bacterium]